MNEMAVPIAVEKPTSQKTTAHAKQVEEEYPQSLPTHDDAMVTIMQAAKVEQMVSFAKTKLDVVRELLQTTRGKFVQVKENIWKEEGTNCAAVVIQQ